MELQSQEGGEMPMPINSSYGGQQHMIHHDPHAPHNHIMPVSSAAPQISSINGPPPMSSSALLDHHQDHSSPPPSSYKKVVKYRECLKNHAASMGGNATDGCGEFMPSGEEGSIEALTCSACNCHRNFHRKEVEGETPPFSSTPFECYRFGRKLFLGHHQKAFPGHESLGFHTGALISSRSPAPQQMIMSGYTNMGSLLPYSDQSDDQQEDGVGLSGGGGGVSATRPPQMMMMKKRFRTKFTPDQKEKMLQFAEKVGWKIQKQEESVVQQFCQEVGVKRRVLKVWMHNNKHNLAKKNITEIAPQDQV